MNQHDMNRILSSAKLTEKQVLEIHDSDKTLRALGKKYGVHHGTIHNIKLEKSWKYLWNQDEVN